MALMAVMAALCVAVSGQETMTWHDARPLVHGTGFPAAVKGAFYDRLPAGAINTTRGAVWSLSRDSTGLFAQVWPMLVLVFFSLSSSCCFSSAFFVLLCHALGGLVEHTFHVKTTLTLWTEIQ